MSSISQTQETPSIPIKKRKLFSSFKQDLTFAIGSPALVWQVLFFYAPIFLMLISSFSRINIDGAIEGITLDHFRQILKLDYFKVIFSSILLSLSTSTITLLLGFPLSYFIVFRSGKLKNFFLFLLIIPFWTNFLLHIYAWFFVLEKAGFLNQLLLFFNIIQSPIHFLNTPFAVHLMMAYYFLPFMALPLYSSLEKFDPTLIEASLDLGANKVQTFKRVLLPIMMPAIKTGLFLVFIPSFGEFVIPELMGGDKYYFVGSVVSQFVLGEKTAPIGMAFTVISALTLLVASLTLFLACNRFSKFLTRGS